MANPTRAQIEADVTQPAVQVEIAPAGSWIDVTSHVARVDQSIATAGDVSGIAFGTSVGMTAEVEVHQTAFGYATDLTPIRISYGFASSDKLRRFVGLIVRERRNTVAATWSCRGVDARMEGEEIRSPLFRKRAVATATTLISIEDPANPNYRGGLFNYICWMCGGRPWEQSASYPNAPFFYSAARPSLIAPEWPWINAENAWEELGRACRAVGGQIYQDHEGVLRYVDPLGIVPATATYTYTDEVLTQEQRAAQSKSGFVDASFDKDLDHTVTGFSCTYIERNLDGLQLVYEDRTSKALGAAGQANDDLPLHLDTQLPVYRVARVEVDAAHTRTGARLNAAQLTVAITGTAAQRVAATLSNTTTNPALVYTIRVYGRPVVAGEEGSVTYTGASSLPITRILPLENNVYVQSRSHAERLARMAFDFYSQPRPVVTLSGCGYDPDRYVGERVNLTYAGWGYTNEPHRIVAIRPQDGATMDLDLIPIGDLPVAGDFFQFNTTYASPGSTSRQLVY